MFHGTSKRKGVGVIVVRHSKMTTSSGTTWIGWSAAAHLKLGEYHLADAPKSDTIRGMAVSGLVYVNADDRLRWKALCKS